MPHISARVACTIAPGEVEVEEFSWHWPQELLLTCTTDWTTLMLLCPVISRIEYDFNTIDELTVKLNIYTGC